MIVFFSPGQAIFSALLLAIVGTSIINLSVHQSHQDHPLWLGVALGAAIDALALWIIVTALRWIFCATAVFFRGPPRG